MTSELSPEQKEFFEMANGYCEYISRMLYLNKQGVAFAMVMVKDSHVALVGNTDDALLKQLITTAAVMVQTVEPVAAQHDFVPDTSLDTVQ